jgi:hypothetical protein
MTTIPALTYTAPCPHCGHNCTWTATTYYIDTGPLQHTVSDTDGGNCRCTPAAATAGQEAAA